MRAWSPLARRRSTLIKSLNDMVGDVASLASVRDPQAAAYWAYHAARMSFFIVQVKAHCPTTVHSTSATRLHAGGQRHAPRLCARRSGAAA